MAEVEDGATSRYVRPPKRLVFPVQVIVPETKRHLELRTALYQILKLAFSDRALIGSDQFVYWDPTDPSACLAPDVFVRLGAPDERFDSWKVWERGAPHLAVEIVSREDSAESRWIEKLEKYRRLGTAEVVRFDADHAPQLRIWDHLNGDLVEREIEPGHTAECRALGLHWVVVVDDVGDRALRLARDSAGVELLPTEEELRRAAEQERATAEQERATAEQGRATAEHQRMEAERQRDVALVKIRELEEELRNRDKRSL